MRSRSQRPAPSRRRPATRYQRLTNAVASPYRYEIDADELLAAELESAGDAIWGIVHSHVASAAVPTRTGVEP